MDDIKSIILYNYTYLAVILFYGSIVSILLIKSYAYLFERVSVLIY